MVQTKLRIYRSVTSKFFKVQQRFMFKWCLIDEFIKHSDAEELRN